MTLKMAVQGQKQALLNLIEKIENHKNDLECVLSLTEVKGNNWTLDIYFEEEPHTHFIADQLNSLLEGVEHTLEELPDKDWVTESQQNLKPVIAGRFFVHGSHDSHLVPNNCHRVLIDAATAFGTGHHGTTKGCLLALSDIAKKMAPQKIVDIGCGSAILAIAAAKQFKAGIIASDIDPISVSVARKNIKLNQVQDFIRTVRAKGFSAPLIAHEAPYDVILANILPAPLCDMAQDMKEHTTSGSRLILSGILTEQGKMVEACYRNRGFVIEKRYILDEWLTLILIRK